MSRSLPTSPLRFVIPTIREDSGAEVEEESDQQWIERQKQQQLLWNVVRDQIIARRVMREKMEAQKKEWKQWENVEEVCCFVVIFSFRTLSKFIFLSLVCQEENLNTALALYRHRNQIEESSVEAQSPEVDADSAMDVVAAQLSRAIDEMRFVQIFSPSSRNVSKLFHFFPFFKTDYVVVFMLGTMQLLLDDFHAL
jgi:hypothetical protein